MTDATTAEHFIPHRRTAIAELADWHPRFDMAGVSVSEQDALAGSPKQGDKIARNPKNHADRWLVAADYFRANFELETRTTSDPAAAFLRLAAQRGGRIVSSNDLTEHQIAEARVDKVFFADADGFGWAILGWDLTTTKDRKREADYFSKHNMMV